MTRDPAEVLRHSLQADAANQATVKRHYLRYRKDQGIPQKCDMPDCPTPETWKGKQPTLILDHIRGNPGANRIEDLRLVCPNCASLLPTHGGGNKGRVVEITESLYFHLVDGTKNWLFGKSCG